MEKQSQNNQQRGVQPLILFCFWISFSAGHATTLTYTLEPPDSDSNLRKVRVYDEETSKSYTIDTRERINCFRGDAWMLPEGTNFFFALSVAYIAPGSNTAPRDFKGSLSVSAHSSRDEFTTNNIIGGGAWMFDFDPQTTTKNLATQHVSRRQLGADLSLYFCTLIVDVDVYPALRNSDPPALVSIWMSAGNELNHIRWPENPDGFRPNNRFSIEEPSAVATNQNALHHIPALEISLRDGQIFIFSSSTPTPNSILEESILTSRDRTWHPVLAVTSLTNGWLFPAPSESKIFRLRLASPSQ